MFVELGCGIRPPGALDLAGFNFHVPTHGSAAIATVARAKAKTIVAATAMHRVLMSYPFGLKCGADQGIAGRFPSQLRRLPQCNAIS